MSALVSTYCGLGWQMLRLWGVRSVGVCRCPKGSDCGCPGKHPVDSAWQESATNDEETIMSWLETGRNNLGLLLGPRSGIIDVELDGEEAKAAWNSLGLGEVWTPTYTAGRGPHRLFKWRSDLPPVGVVKPMGIEVRIGNGSAIQSVLPPSIHHSGKQYQWLQGMGPDDIQIAPLPERLVNLLWNHDASNGGTGKKPVIVAMQEPVKSGDRNNTIYRFAVYEGFRCFNIDDPQEQQYLFAKIVAMNDMQCKPPLPQSEVRAIFQNAISFVRKSDAAGVGTEEALAKADEDIAGGTVQANAPVKRAPQWVQSFTEKGLLFGVPRQGGDAEWWPGEWSLTVVHSDPLEYRLFCPLWKKWTVNGSGSVSLTVDQFRSATKVASAVLSATGVVMLDDEPKRWKLIWDGAYKVRDAQGKPRTVRGVKAKLIDNAAHEFPGASSLRYVVLAGWLYDRLVNASQPTDDDVPDPTGRAAWRQDGTLWFQWAKVWEDIERNHRVMEGERLSLKRRLLADTGLTDWPHGEFKHASGTRKTYCIWTRDNFHRLECLAAEQHVPNADIRKAAEEAEAKAKAALPDSAAAVADDTPDATDPPKPAVKRPQSAKPKGRK